MFKVCISAVLLMAALAAKWLADEVPLRALEKSEMELVAICNEMTTSFDEYYERAGEIEDEAKRKKFEKENDPSAKYVQKLIDFERVHHTTHAGLMAARQLIFLAGSGGEIENARDQGRRRALIALRDYATADELPDIIRHLDGGNSEAESLTLLRDIINSTLASDRNKAFARYYLATNSLRFTHHRVSLEKRLRQLSAGEKPRYPDEHDELQKILNGMLSFEECKELERQAIALLESLSLSDPALRQPVVIGIDPSWIVVQFDPNASQRTPLLKDLAAGMLFREQHLQIGKPAPHLAVSLVTGLEWSLEKQQGKAVIIQFSFTGCGPCEEMYPDLRLLQLEYPDKLAILTIMADETREGVMNAVESGKLTWNIFWDGERGPIATKWAVSFFPTIFIVGPDGTIAEIGLRGERLKAKIAELTK